MRSPWIAIGISAFLVISALLRMFKGYSIPPLAIASFSVVAVFTSVADLLEVMRTRRLYQSITLFLALFFFIGALSVWVFPTDLNEKIAQIIGDGFTIIGIASVIGIFGYKELKAPSGDRIHQDHVKELQNVTLSDKELEYMMTKREYEEMLKLNDIIENLKILTSDTFPLNRVHDGWALFYDTLSDYWNRWKSPFYDGLNRDSYYKYLLKLDKATDRIGVIADTDYRAFRHTKVKMWNEEIDVTIQPRINNPHIPTIKEVNEKLNEALEQWDNLKVQITQRYERERAQQ